MAATFRRSSSLGVMYANGLGVDRDMKSAMDWWRRAASQLHVRAAHNLALAILAGEPKVDGVPADPDYGAALRYLKIGADAPVIPIREYTLGKLYQEGVGVEKDERRAANSSSAPASRASPGAVQSGQVYRDGAGMTASEELSLFWFAEKPPSAAMRRRRTAWRSASSPGAASEGRDRGAQMVDPRRRAGRAGGHERRRFDLSARLDQTDIDEAERRAAEFAPRKGAGAEPAPGETP